MKITNIEIKNFRAFPQIYHINLHNAGKNLLVYGENGSGKSSLYLALKYFLESSMPENSEDNRTGSLKPTRTSLPRILVISNFISFQNLNERKTPTSGQEMLKKQLTN